MQIQWLANALNLSSHYAGDFTGISIDTRTLKPGDCYIALKGEQFDGHAFVGEALAKGASSCIVQDQPNQSSQPLLVVEDTLKALQTIAYHYRKRHDLPIIALTGSCGKTTVKGMLSAVLPEPNLATQGNLNNHIGAPLTLLNLNESHQYAAIELGANHVGEIATTVALVEPDISLITNVAPAHLEGFGSIEVIAKTKGEIFTGTKKNGCLVVNLDDKRIVAQASPHSQKKIYFSLDNCKADVYAQDIVLNEEACAQFTAVVDGKVHAVQLAVPGKHNVMNALSVLAVALGLGLDIAKAAMDLAKFVAVDGRLKRQISSTGAVILNDCYNANLRSVEAAIDVLASLSGYKFAVLGELAEVGSELTSHYHQIGTQLTNLAIDELVTVGASSYQIAEAFSGIHHHFNEKSKAIEYLLENVSKKSCVLIKGSRSARLETIVSALDNHEIIT